VGIRVKTMAEIRRIVDLYDLYGSYRRVSRELGISRNTVRKYVHRVKEVQNGMADEILPKDRKILQRPRVLTDAVRQKIHAHLESNRERPRKQRLTAKRIWELLVKDGHKIGYTSVKDEVARWNASTAIERCTSSRNPALVSELSSTGVTSSSASEEYGRNSTLPYLC
jgi:transposase